MTNENILKDLPGVDGVKYYDVKSAVEDITAGSFAKLNYTSRVLAENLLRKCPSEDLKDSLVQLIEKEQTKISLGFLQSYLSRYFRINSFRWPCRS